MNALPLRVTSTEQRTNLVIRRKKKKMHSDILVTIREPKRKKKRS